MPIVRPRTSWLPDATLRQRPSWTSRERSPRWRDSITTSASISSATERVFENGALNAGTPRRLAGPSAIWLVPMQNAPTAIMRLASASTAAVTWVLLRIPSTWASRTRWTSSASGSAARAVSTWKPSARNASTATGWMFSSSRILISDLGNDVCVTGCVIPRLAPDAQRASQLPGIARRERVARVEPSGLEPGAEPAHALGRGAVRERLGVDLAAGLVLQAVVADRGRRGDRALDVTGLEQALPPGVVAPHAGEAVGLELGAHRDVVAAVATAEQLRPLLDAQQLLQVVPHLVGEHVGLREVTRRAEPLLELAVERQVDVGVLVGRAVERADRARRSAAPGVDRAGEQHQLGVAVRLALGLEPGLEHVLDVLHRELDELDQIALRVRAARRMRLGPAPGGGPRPGVAGQAPG